MALGCSEWLCVTETTSDFNPVLSSWPALHISAYPRIHMCTDTAWTNQWRGREEMVLEGCQAGSSEWPYMVKSAVSRTERQKRHRQRQPSGIEVLETQADQSMGGKTIDIMHTQCIFVC